MWDSHAGLLIPAVGIRALTHHATDKPLPPDAQRNGACVREFRAVVKAALPNCVMVAVGGQVTPLSGQSFGVVDIFVKEAPRLRARRPAGETIDLSGGPPHPAALRRMPPMSAEPPRRLIPLLPARLILDPVDHYRSGGQIREVATKPYRSGGQTGEIAANP